MVKPIRKFQASWVKEQQKQENKSGIKDCSKGESHKLLAYDTTKGQLISKAIYGLLTSPKKRTDEFVLFAFLLFTANKSNLSVCFLGESTMR